MIGTWLGVLRDLDRRRTGARGEHWAAAGAGLGLLMSARRRPSRLGRAVTLLAGIALLARAATGRDGLLSRMRRRDTAAPIGR